MSISISIHDMDDETAEWLRREAEARGTTIEKLALELILQGIQHLELPTCHDIVLADSRFSATTLIPGG